MATWCVDIICYDGSIRHLSDEPTRAKAFRLAIDAERPCRVHSLDRACEHHPGERSTLADMLELEQ